MIQRDNRLTLGSGVDDGPDLGWRHWRGAA